MTAAPLDVWGKLWDLATDDTSVAPATIVPDRQDPGRVWVQWADGSCAVLEWDDGAWQYAAREV